MPDLIAQGPSPELRWRRTLEPDRVYVVGREAGGWATPWDRLVSRRHVEVCWRDGRLYVRRLPDARNPVYVAGAPQDTFTRLVGEHFVIGETTFTLVEDGIHIACDPPPPTAEQTFSADELRRLRFRNADQRIDLLSRVPEIIDSATSDEELWGRLTNILLDGIPAAVAAALVAVEGDAPTAPVRVLYWDRRQGSTGAFQPSDRLIRQAVRTRQSVAHVWGAGGQPATRRTTNDDDWAFCSPVRGRASRGWAIYVAGRWLAEPIGPSGLMVAALQEDLKFAELAAAMLSSLRDVRQLERRQANLRPFFAPIVLEALARQDPDEALAPREADVSVLFCDLRGFTRRSEQWSHDLHGLLRRVSDALGVATRQVFQAGGVVGDFHGDAAMGFWGWPFDQPDGAVRACRAALAIRGEFAAMAAHPNHPLADFRLGIGIASGRAVAGKIGAVDQVKVTVFGPVVNRAARLETMTKILRAPILMDAATARAARDGLCPSGGRVRRVAVVDPEDGQPPLEVSELTPPAAELPELSDQDIARYESALVALRAGNWEQAFQLLHQVTAADRVKDFLTVFIAQHNRTPPAGWNGVVPLSTK